MRIIFVFTLLFFLTSCAVTPRFLIGQTSGISLMFIPKEQSAGPATDAEPVGQESEPTEFESRAQQERRQKLMRSVLYGVVIVAAVASLGYLVYSADDSGDEESCPSGECYVSGYYRSSGTYVEGYCRRC
jgi:hypothetical protein